VIIPMYKTNERTKDRPAERWKIPLDTEGFSVTLYLPDPRVVTG
jgi:hypothetical protein